MKLADLRAIPWRVKILVTRKTVQPADGPTATGSHPDTPDGPAVLGRALLDRHGGIWSWRTTDTMLRAGGSLFTREAVERYGGPTREVLLVDPAAWQRATDRAELAEVTAAVASVAAQREDVRAVPPQHDARIRTQAGQDVGEPTEGPDEWPVSDDEHTAVRLAGELYTHIVTKVIGHGPTRQADTAELAALVHHIQHAVMSQAAARAYPDLYRLLGETHLG